MTADTWWAWFRLNAIFLCVAIVLLFAALSVVPLTLFHVYVALVNLTTWELTSSHRIPYLRHLDDVNPFHHGYLHNVLMFCCRCRPQNWEMMYTRHTQQMKTDDT